MLTLVLSLALAASQADLPPPPPGSDWVLPPGTSFYSTDTGTGPIRVKSMTLPVGSYLSLIGDQPFVVLAEDTIRIEGTLDGSGFDQKELGSLSFDLPLYGAPGGPGGGSGGLGYPGQWLALASGGAGELLSPSGAMVARGGGGGESGIPPLLALGLGPLAAGGGGGAFGPDVSGGGGVSGPGLSASAGFDGHPLALGALSGLPWPQGGAIGGRAFVDGDPTNDFLGVKLDRLTGMKLTGELRHVRGGAGGGGGGASLPAPWVLGGTVGPQRFFKGYGGGGGGGAVLLVAKRIEVAGSALLSVDGGSGLGAGQPSGSFAASGGGSGGLLLLAADVVELGGEVELSARGGAGGMTWGGATGSIGFGGDGGPGLIQVHVPDPAGLVLPSGKTLADVTVPDAHSLLPLEL